MSALTTPTGVLVGTYKDQSPDWYAARGNRIGGSEIAAILGLSKYQSAFSLWHIKAGLLEETRENDEMHAGKVLEPIILAEWERKQDMLDLAPRPCGSWAHKDRPWQLANPDGFAWDDEAGLCGVVEAKFALYADEWGTPGTDEIPPYYLAQCRWYLDTLGFRECWLEVFIGSQGQFRTYRIEADEADQKLMRDKARAFLDTLPGGPNEQRPDIDGHTATYEAVRKQHPEIDPVDVEISADLARAYCEARRTLADAEAFERQTKAQILDAIGNGKRARFMGQTIAQRQAKGEGPPYLVAGRTLPDFSKDEAA